MFTRAQLEREHGLPFTDGAMGVIHAARGEAGQLMHNFIGTEHLLLGYLQFADSGLTKKLNLDIAVVRNGVQEVVGRGSKMVLGEIGLTPRSKKVLELGADEARRLKDLSLEPDHIMLGLVREREGIAAGVLMSLGVTMDRAREVVLERRQHPIDRLRFFLADPQQDPAKKKLLADLLENVADAFAPAKSSL